MTEKRQFDSIKEKLDKLLCDNCLVGEFHCNSYPIYLSISQDVSPAAQMELYDTSDAGVSARDSRLLFIFQDASILVRTDSRMIIPDDLMSKIKGLAKKMHYMHLQIYFRTQMEMTSNFYDIGDPAGDDSEEDLEDDILD